MHFSFKDFSILAIFTILITFHPYYLHGEIDIYELGIYLPGVRAILDGQIPFRDFFYLRGPFELYIPAFLMNIFGEKVSVMATYFYVGTVLTLIICILIGQRLYRERLVLYLMVPVLIGKTFPRVVFTYWGGARYCWGLLAIFFAIQFLYRVDSGRNRVLQKSADVWGEIAGSSWKWLFFSGIISFLAFITSVEIGFCAILGVGGALLFSWKTRFMSKSQWLKSLLIYGAGIAMVGLPYLGSLIATHSLVPYIESTCAVTANMQKVINLHFISTMPGNLLEALIAMVSPLHENFRHMTPAYLYVFLLGYLILIGRQKKITYVDQAAVCVGIYGLSLYVLAFRAIWASQFEMALQPEKILLFFLLEKLYKFLKQKKKELSDRRERRVSENTTQQRDFSSLSGKIFLIQILFLAFIGSSLGNAIHRYNHRFYAFRWAGNILTGKSTASLIPLADEKQILLTSGRAQGMTVTVWQAKDFEQLTKFIQENTAQDEPVLMFPDIGFYNFLVDRNSVGRFPIPIFSWFDEKWHDEFFSDLKKTQPKYAVLPKTLTSAYESVYFKVPQNRYKFLEIQAFIDEHYTPVTSTPGLIVYQRKGI